MFESFIITGAPAVNIVCHANKLMHTHQERLGVKKCKRRINIFFSGLRILFYFNGSGTGNSHGR